MNRHLNKIMDEEGTVLPENRTLGFEMEFREGFYFIKRAYWCEEMGQDSSLRGSRHSKSEGDTTKLRK